MAHGVLAVNVEGWKERFSCRVSNIKRKPHSAVHRSGEHRRGGRRIAATGRPCTTGFTIANSLAQKVYITFRARRWSSWSVFAAHVIKRGE